MLTALTQAVSDLRNRLKAKACSDQSSRGLELVELEDRILYSASPIVGELMVAVDGVSPEASAGDWSLFCATDEATDTVDSSLLETDGAGWRTGKSLQPESKTTNNSLSPASQFPGAGTDPSHLTGLGLPTSEAPSGQREAARTQLVFVDPTVQDYERLLSDVLTNREDAQPVDVILLDGSRDGMEQITKELANRADLDAVHIVSHGADGKLRLGNVWLSTESVDGYAGDLAGWGNSLSDEADLLFYGCDLADGGDGRELVEAISVLTGADVVASVDGTGHDSLGGDWELEYSTGLIETNTVFSYLVRDNWHGLLDAAVVVVDTSADTSDGNTTSIAALQADKGADGLISLREAILAANNTPNSGVPDEIHFDIGAGGIQTIRPTSALPTISDAVVIDGTTQPGYSGSPIIELDGTLTTWDDGIVVSGGGTTIRGLVINRFDDCGIRIIGAGANVIEGNYIGTDISGNNALGNGGDGISVDSGATDNAIQGNYVGTEASGSLNLGNADNGIEIADGSSNVIGGTSSGEGNTVANNLNTGISVEQGTQNEIRGNSTYDNAGLGIDLDTSGVAANDAGDVDSGANQLQNYPVLSSAIVSASEITISGTFSSAANTTYEIDFYSNTIPDGSGHGEGEVYLGSTTVTTNASGSAGFTVLLPGVTTADGDLISATATDPAGNTSEFATNVMATSDDPPILLTEVPVTIDGSEDDVWNAATAHEIHHVTIGEVTDASDLSATWKSLWDNDYLYFLVDVTDDFLIDDTGPGDPWMDDIVEIFIDADASQGISYDGINDFHFGFRWNDSAVYVGPNSVADTTGVTFSLFNTPSGYRLEAAIPWTTLGVQPAVDEMIAMDVQVADDDDGGARDGKRGWYATAEVSFHDASAFVPALLVDSQAISFWLSTSEDVASPSGAPGVDSWSSGSVLRFGNPGLVLEPGTTNGFFTTPANIDAFAGDGSANIDALHFVTQDISMGGANAVSVSVGDILISTADDETFTSTNSVSVTDGDLLLVHFDTPGDYTSATFTVLLDDVETLLGFDDLTGISLVEMDTDIGDATVCAGEFLFTRDGVDEQNDIYVFRTTDVGEGTTAGTAEVLIEGTQIGIDQAITGVELIEQSISAGGKAILAGQILLTLDADDDDIGDDLLDTNQQDFFALDVAQTTLVNGTTGAFIDAFVTAGSGGLDAPDGILFGADANLYVASSSDGSVLRYDGTTGAFIDSFALTGGTGYTDLEFGPDGNLYVSNLSLNRVLRFDGTTGAFVDDFVTTGSGGLNGAAGLPFGPDGNLYVVGRDAAVSVDLFDVNEAPTGLDASFTVTNDSSDGTPVGTVPASDPDAGDALTYTITGGNTDGAFAIDSATGLLTVANADTFDIESSPTYTLTVEIEDTSGLIDTANVTIDLVEPQEVPPGNDDYLRRNESPETGTQSASETLSLLSRGPDSRETETSPARIDPLAFDESGQALMASGTPGIAGHVDATDSVGHQMPRRNDAELLVSTSKNPLLATSGETSQEIAVREVASKHVPSDATAERQDTPDNGEHQASDAHDSSDQTQNALVLNPHAVKANIVAVVSIAACYLLSKIPTGAKKAAAKSAATADVALATPVADETDDEPKETTFLDDTPMDEAVEEIDILDESTGYIELVTDEPADAMPAEDEAEEIIIGVEYDMSDFTVPEFDAPASSSLAIPATDSPSVEIDVEESDPASEDSAEAETPDVESSDDAVRVADEKPASLESRLLAAASSLYQGLRNCFSKKANTGNGSPEEEFPMERKLDRFL